jgi:hypothetical protein
MLEKNKDKRITIVQIMQHPWIAKWREQQTKK